MNEKLQEVLSSVVESKVTRAEVVELALNSLRQKLIADLAAAEARWKEVNDNLSTSAALQILRSVEASKVEVVVKPHREWVNGSSYRSTGHDLTVSTRLAEGFAFPKAYTAAIAEREKLDEEISSIKHEIRQLSGAGIKARVALIRMALDASPNGAKVLAAIDGLRDEVHAGVRALPSGS